MPEREPHLWSLPLPWRPLGVSVRVHVLFPCVAVGVILWVATSKEFDPHLWRYAITAMAMLFVAVALHEVAHVVGARRADGDVPEITLWPLGGLSPADIPHSPRAYAWTALAGPVMNLALAGAAAGALAVHGYWPPPNPLASPFNPRLENWRDHKTYFSFANPGQAELYYYPDPENPAEPVQVKLTFRRTEDGQRYLEYPNPSSQAVPPVLSQTDKEGRAFFVLKDKGQRLEAARLTPAPLLLAQFFTINWFLFCINLLPAFPLDGARLLQAWRWRRRDYRTATAFAAYVGFVVMLGVGIYAIAVNELLPAGLAAMIYVCCRQQLLQLERTDEEPPLGAYDFSEGFTSLEREEPPAPPPPPPSLLQRWLRDRAERRRQREEQRRLAEERRLDALLDKIHHHGRASLTGEELRFLRRMSERYPNRK